MFGFFKRKEYEKNVRVILHAMFADLPGTSSDQHITSKLVESYGENWAALIKNSITSGKSAELTALIIAVTLFQDVLNNKVSEEEIIEIQKCILEERQSTDAAPIMFRLQFFTMVASSMQNVEANQVAIAMRDIHRAIFKDGDAYLNKTTKYLIESGNRIKQQISGKANG